MSATSLRKTNFVSVVIPTYRREQVLIDTISHLLQLEPAPSEILVVDQTPEHEPVTSRELDRLDKSGAIRWMRLPQPSITHAMNVGLGNAQGEVVLFLDDDIIPHPDLIAAHTRAHAEGHRIVAGQVLQPGEEPLSLESESDLLRFNSSQRRYVSEMMGGNFSVNKRLGLDVGGFDENFVHVAYRYEAEFAKRVLTAGEKILFEPMASIRHLKAGSGGTRAFGLHLTTVRPSHTVGSYYFLLQAKNVPQRFLRILYHPFRAIRTKHHLTHPWWIPLTLIAETAGLLWAAFLYLRGPRLINQPHYARLEHD